MLIIVRVGLGFSSWTETPVGTIPTATRGRFRQDARDPASPLRMITFNMTRTVERQTVTDFALPQARGKAPTGDADEDTEIAKHSPAEV